MRRYGESKEHEAAKERVGRICRDKGWTVEVDSYEFKCRTEKGERIYWPDVYAQNFCILCYAKQKIWRIQSENGARRIIVEVQGFKGHQSKAAFQADRLRIQDIREAHGSDIEYYCVSLNKRIGPMDIRTWSRLDIAEHLGLG